MKKSNGLDLKANDVEEEPLAHYFRMQASFVGFDAVSTKGRGAADLTTMRRKGIPPLQESAASFGAASTSVSFAEGTPAFSRPSR
jgi:hypothetical protein